MTVVVLYRYLTGIGTIVVPVLLPVLVADLLEGHGGVLNGGRPTLDNRSQVLDNRSQECHCEHDESHLLDLGEVELVLDNVCDGLGVRGRARPGGRDRCEKGRDGKD